MSSLIYKASDLNLIDSPGDRCSLLMLLRWRNGEMHDENFHCRSMENMDRLYLLKDCERIYEKIEARCPHKNK